MKRKLITRQLHRFTSLPVGLLLAAALLGGTCPAQAQGRDDFYGVMFSYDQNVAVAKPKLNDLGVKWCRLWVDIRDWQTPANNTGNAFQQALDLHAAGYKVILEINSLNGTLPTYTQAQNVYTWLLAKPGLKDAVDMWEIFNELNNTQYYAEAYSTTISLDDQARHYVNGPLKAAWDVFHPLNEKVLGGSWTLWQQRASGSAAASYNLNLTAAYVRNGYLSYCDYAGLHPYHETASGQRNATTSAKQLFGTKPLIITEWGLKLTGYNVTTYTQAMSENLSFMRANALTACYYRWSPGNGYYGLVSGSTATPVEPAYSTYKSWPKTTTMLSADTCTQPTALAFLSAYPNPSVSGQATLVYSALRSQPLAVRVFDQQGRLMASCTMPVGEQELRLPATLLPGLYFLEATLGKEHRRLTVLVQ